MIDLAEETTGRVDPATFGKYSGKEFDVAERAEAIQKVEAIQIAERLSNEQVGRMIGCSGATWWLVRKGKYSGNTDKFIGRAKAWLENREASREQPSADFAETRIARRILKVCRYACDTRDMGMVLTRAGCGKTTALEEFARRRGDGAVLIRASQYVSSKTALLRELARALGLRTAASATFEGLAQDVRESLAGSYNKGVGTPRCILVDEAHELRPPAIDMLRNLHDDPACKAVVILAATWHLHKDMRRLRGLVGGFEQITSRIGACYAMRDDERIADDDVRLLADATAKAQGFRAELPAESLKYLAGLAAEDGALRNVVKRLQASYQVADSAGREPAYSVHELDYAGQVMGRASQLDQRAPPWAREPAEAHFGAAGGEAKTA